MGGLCRARDFHVCVKGWRGVHRDWAVYGCRYRCVCGGVLCGVSRLWVHVRTGSMGAVCKNRRCPYMEAVCEYRRCVCVCEKAWC